VVLFLFRLRSAFLSDFLEGRSEFSSGGGLFYRRSIRLLFSSYSLFTLRDGDFFVWGTAFFFPGRHREVMISARTNPASRGTNLFPLDAFILASCFHVIGPRQPYPPSACFFQSAAFWNKLLAQDQKSPFAAFRRKTPHRLATTFGQEERAHVPSFSIRVISSQLQVDPFLSAVSVEGPPFPPPNLPANGGKLFF